MDGREREQRGGDEPGARTEVALTELGHDDDRRQTTQERRQPQPDFAISEDLVPEVDEDEVGRRVDVAVQRARQDQRVAAEEVRGEQLVDPDALGVAVQSQHQRQGEEPEEREAVPANGSSRCGRVHGGGARTAGTRASHFDPLTQGT